MAARTCRWRGVPLPTYLYTTRSPLGPRVVKTGRHALNHKPGDDPAVWRNGGHTTMRHIRAVRVMAGAGASHCRYPAGPFSDYFRLTCYSRPSRYRTCDHDQRSTRQPPSREIRPLTGAAFFAVERAFDRHRMRRTHHHTEALMAFKYNAFKIQINRVPRILSPVSRASRSSATEL